MTAENGIIIAPDAVLKRDKFAINMVLQVNSKQMGLIGLGLIFYQLGPQESSKDQCSDGGKDAEDEMQIHGHGVQMSFCRRVLSPNSTENFGFCFC